MGIECYSPQHAFPTATKVDDVIIAIGLCSRTLYADSPQAAREERVVLSLHDVAVPPNTNVTVVNFDTEVALLKAFAAYVQHSDADVLVGYNTCGFDWKYIRDRLVVVEEWTQSLDGPKSEGLTQLSRVTQRACVLEAQLLGSAAMGYNPMCFHRTPGRIGIDLWSYLKRENAPDLPNLKLDTVAAHYLGATHVNLPDKAMFAEYERGPEGRFLVAEHRCQDCMSVLCLLDKLSVLPKLLEMAKVTCTTPHDLLHGGQQISVYARLWQRPTLLTITCSKIHHSTPFQLI